MFFLRLRASRVANHLTQQNMADQLGISLNGYQKYEQGERQPSLDTLVRIVKILNVSADWILGLTDSENSNG